MSFINAPSGDSPGLTAKEKRAYEFQLNLCRDLAQEIGELRPFEVRRLIEVDVKESLTRADEDGQIGLSMQLCRMSIRANVSALYSDYLLQLAPDVVQMINELACGENRLGIWAVNQKRL